jgi:hypothetical protein
VPSSNSDLYKVSVVSKPSDQTHPLLFDKPIFENKLHPNVANSNIGREKLFNHTRNQLRNM